MPSVHTRLRIVYFIIQQPTKTNETLLKLCVLETGIILNQISRGTFIITQHSDYGIEFCINSIQKMPFCTPAKRETFDKRES